MMHEKGNMIAFKDDLGLPMSFSGIRFAVAVCLFNDTKASGGNEVAGRHEQDIIPCPRADKGGRQDSTGTERM